jgi:hypothetical protein
MSGIPVDVQPAGLLLRPGTPEPLHTQLLYYKAYWRKNPLEGEDSQGAIMKEEISGKKSNNIHEGKGYDRHAGKKQPLPAQFIG